MIKGVDISDYQGAPNFEQLKQATDFVIIKSSEGVGYKARELDRSQEEARRVGMGVGYYHFARPDLGNEPEDEAQFFINCIWPLRAGEVLVLDYEVGFFDPVGWCKRFLDYLAAHLNGTKPLIYLNQSQIQNINWKPVIDGGYGLWVASYDNDPSDVHFDHAWPSVAMKQYTSSGTVAGISGKVDMNVFYGDIIQYKKYGYREGQSNTPTTPTPAPDKRIVFFDLINTNVWNKPANEITDVMVGKFISDYKECLEQNTIGSQQKQQIKNLTEQVGALQNEMKTKLAECDQACNAKLQVLKEKIRNFANSL